jgi:protein O-mannosyl-transferase
VVVATIVAYSPVLFSFFVGDDFVHLTWLRHAVNQPELILKNFYSSWLDGTTTKFYRPLISVFMVTDYMIWKTNGLGFHITNLLFHLTSTLALFGIVRQVQKFLVGQKNNTVALLAAAIFALYPLHPEAVSWITGRVDSIVTTFILLSLWTYFEWRETNKLGWLFASLGAFACGLLSKEMAITVPAVICTFELLVQKPALSRFLKTAPYWLVLAGYFAVRRMALGTFVGGYDDSLLYIANLKEFAFGWLHALRMFIIPLNRELLGSHNLLTKGWEIACAASIILGLITFARKEDTRRPMLFALGWMILSLLPVYKLFAIGADLQGSRLAYLATVPLAILFAYGVAAGRDLLRSSRPNHSEKNAVANAITQNALPVVFCLLAGTILWINNQPWREAGLEANAIRASLQDIYDMERGDPQTLLIGMPDQRNGAYISRNAIWGMTKYPQMRGDIWNCLTLNEFEPVHPFGFLKPSLVAARNDVRVYRWDRAKQKFASVEIKSRTTYGGGNDEVSVPFGGPLEVSSPHAKARPELIFSPEISANVSGWDTDFVRVDLEVQKEGNVATGADLLYANDINPEFQLGKRTHCDLIPGQKKQTLFFALRSLPEWSFGNGDGRLKLLLPPQSIARVEAITVVPASKLIPQIDFDNAGYMGTKGYMHVGKDRPTRHLSIDATGIPGAVSTELEITRANMLFEQQNTAKYSTYAREHTPAPLKGTVTLRKEQFTTPGITELRVWAKDASGKLIGLASDHIVIAVDP